MTPAVMIPAWPRAMNRDLACSYCTARADELPVPSYGSGRSARWLRDDLDEHLERLAGRKTTAAAWDEAARA